MFKWRRRRPKGNQADRDLEEAARLLEDAEFGDFLGFSSRRPGSPGPEGDVDDGDVDNGASSGPPASGPQPGPVDWRLEPDAPGGEPPRLARASESASQGTPSDTAPSPDPSPNDDSDQASAAGRLTGPLAHRDP